MRLSFRALLLFGAVIATANLHAQTVDRHRFAPHEIVIAPTYSLLRSNVSSGGGFWLQGAGVDASALFYRQLGLVGSVAGVHNGNIQGHGASLTIVTYLAGPRYTWVPSGKMVHSKKLALFGQGLFGGAHGSDGVFPSSQGARTSANCFALQLGGGVDIGLTKHLVLRPIQLDWLRTQFPNADNSVQNNLRIAFGIAFKL